MFVCIQEEQNQSKKVSFNPCFGTLKIIYQISNSVEVNIILLTPANNHYKSLLPVFSRRNLSCLTSQIMTMQIFQSIIELTRGKKTSYILLMYIPMTKTSKNNCLTAKF